MPSSSQTQTPRKRRGRTGPYVSVRERLERYIERTDGCWTWMGHVDREGYGTIAVNRRPRSAHRVAFEELVGPIPDGLQIDHTCHNADLTCAGGSTCLHRRCVNPQHLEPVTAAVNTKRARAGRDIKAKGSAGKTECIHGHAFSEENTGWYDGRRFCIACARIRKRKNRNDSAQRLRVDHFAMAAALREQPGAWAVVAVYATAATSASMATQIRGGRRLAAYSEKSFEAKARAVNGEYRVYARFVGKQGVR